MTVRLRYSVGDENDPGDPWGRTDLLIHADGSTRLEHHFSRERGVIVRTGRIDVGALDVLWVGLRRAGFPSVLVAAAVPEAPLRRLTVEDDAGSQTAVVGWTQAASLRGYAAAFDVLDGVVRQLSGDAVGYPTKQQEIVHEVVAVSGKLPSSREIQPEVRSARTAKRARLLLVVAVAVVGGLLVYQPVGRSLELDRYAGQLRRTGEPVRAVLHSGAQRIGNSGKTETVCDLRYEFHDTPYDDSFGCDEIPYGEPVTTELIWVNPADPHDYVTENGTLSGTRHGLDFVLGMIGCVLLLTSPAILVWRPGAPEGEPESDPVRAPWRRPMPPIRPKRSRRGRVR
jgi:hypothetical protein